MTNYYYREIISNARMFTPYDLRLVPRFPDLRFSRSVVDLFSCVRSSRFSLCVRPSSFYGIAYFSLPLYPLLPVVTLVFCTYDSLPFVAQLRFPFVAQLRFPFWPYLLMC